MVRAPRVRMLVDGVEVPGLLAADVFASSAMQADRFRAQFVARLVDLAALEAVGAAVSIDVAVDGGGFVSLIVGRVDSVALDVPGGTVEVEGRDLAAVLVDAPAEDAWANQTASEIVAAVAARHGIAADVMGTSEPVGRYDQAGHELLTLPRHAGAGTAWDVLAWLALQEGFLLGMVGERLRFGLRDAAAVPLDVAGCEAVDCERQLGLLRPIEVVVRSWDGRRGAMVEQSARVEGVGPAWQRVLQKPNLDDAGAQRLASRTVADLRRHARTARLSMPGEVGFTAWDRVALRGAGKGWDGDYAVVGLDRHIDVRRGFLQTVRLQGEG